jgi:hypothetical protein
MEPSIRLFFVFSVQLGIGIVFLLSAIPKLRQPHAFVQSVAEYKILPTLVARGFGLLLIPLEAFLAIAFLTGWMTNLAIPLGAMLIIAFLVAVGVNLRRRRRIACGCFGNAREQISFRTVVRLCLLLAAALFLFVAKNILDTWLPDLTTTVVTSGMLVYVLLPALQAIFLLLIAAWVLSLPELASIVRYRHSLSIPPNQTKTEAGRV